MWGGTVTCGRSEARQAPSPRTVSGLAAIPSRASANPAVEEPEDEPGRVGAVVDEQAGGERAEREAAERTDDAHQRPEPGPLRRGEVDQHRAQGAHRGAGRDPLQGPGGEQPADAVGEREREHRGDLDPERGEDRRPAADVVGDRADDEQRDEQRDRVDGEDAGQRHVDENPNSSWKTT